MRLSSDRPTAYLTTAIIMLLFFFSHSLIVIVIDMCFIMHTNRSCTITYMYMLYRRRSRCYITKLSPTVHVFGCCCIFLTSFITKMSSRCHELALYTLTSLTFHPVSFCSFLYAGAASHAFRTIADVLAQGRLFSSLTMITAWGINAFVLYSS